MPFLRRRKDEERPPTEPNFVELQGEIDGLSLEQQQRFIAFTVHWRRLFIAELLREVRLKQHATAVEALTYGDTTKIASTYLNAGRDALARGTATKGEDKERCLSVAQMCVNTVEDISGAAPSEDGSRVDPAIIHAIATRVVDRTVDTVIDAVVWSGGNLRDARDLQAKTYQAQVAFIQQLKKP